MKYSTKVSDAVHILSFIALNAKESPDEPGHRRKRQNEPCLREADDVIA